MFFAGGGAEGGDGVAQALLGQGDNVHVALNHHDFVEVAIALACLIKAVEFLAFMEDRGFRGVEVLGLVVAQYPAAESDDASAAVADGENYPVAKAVVAFDLLGVLGVFHQQTGVDQVLLRQVVATQMFVEVVPAWRGEAEAEVAGNFAGQAAAFQIVDGRFAGRMAFQGLAVKLGGGG